MQREPYNVGPVCIQSVKSISTVPLACYLYVMEFYAILYISHISCVIERVIRRQSGQTDISLAHVANSTVNTGATQINVPKHLSWEISLPPMYFELCAIAMPLNLHVEYAELSPV